MCPILDLLDCDAGILVSASRARFEAAEPVGTPDAGAPEADAAVSVSVLDGEEGYGLKCSNVGVVDGGGVAGREVSAGNQC